MGHADCMGGVGHMKFIWHSESSVVESRLLNEYGSVVRIKGPLLVRQDLFGVAMDTNERKGRPTLDRRP